VIYYDNSVVTNYDVNSLKSDVDSMLHSAGLHAGASFQLKF